MNCPTVQGLAVGAVVGTLEGGEVGKLETAAPELKIPTVSWMASL
jgi:hypothetical protein